MVHKRILKYYSNKQLMREFRNPANMRDKPVKNVIVDEISYRKAHGMLRKNAGLKVKSKSEYDKFYDADFKRVMALK